MCIRNHLCVCNTKYIEQDQRWHFIAILLMLTYIISTLLGTIPNSYDFTNTQIQKGWTSNEKWRASNEHSSPPLSLNSYEIFYKKSKVEIIVIKWFCRCIMFIWGPWASFEALLKGRASNENGGPQMKSLGPQMNIKIILLL